MKREREREAQEVKLSEKQIQKLAKYKIERTDIFQATKPINRENLEREREGTLYSLSGPPS